MSNQTPATSAPSETTRASCTRRCPSLRSEVSVPGPVMRSPAASVIVFVKAV